MFGGFIQTYLTIVFVYVDNYVDNTILYVDWNITVVGRMVTDLIISK